MSDIYLLYQNDTISDQRTAAKRCLVSSCRHRHNGVFEKDHPNAYLGFRYLNVTGKSGSGSHHAEYQGMWCAIDGQIDNVSQIARITRQNEKNIAYQVLQLYKKCGLSWLWELEGPFAFVVVDTINQQVLIFRDSLGRRPLYYYCDADKIMVASQERMIAAHPDIPISVDETMIASVFSIGQFHAIGHTAFDSINELLPGEYLVWEKGVWQKQRRSLQFSSNLLKYPKDEDYAMHYRNLLERTVLRRLPETGTVGVMLSSGLDSAPAAAVAGKELRLRNQSFKAYSWCLPGFNVADESSQIQEVADYIGIPLELTNVIKDWPIADPEHWPISLNGPVSNMTQLMKDSVLKAASQDNCRVMLNGWFGDKLYSYGRDWLVDGFRSGAYKTTILELLWLLGDRGLWRLMASLSRNNLLITNSPDTSPELPWMTPYAESLLECSLWPPECANHRRPKQCAVIFGPRSFQWGGLGKELQSRFAIEMVDLYREKEMIDFMLSIPSTQFKRNGQYKYIARNAVQGLVSDRIRLQKRVGILSEFIYYGIWERSKGWIAKRLFERDGDWSRYVKREWLLEQFQQSSPSDKATLVVWQCLIYELWLEKLTELKT